MTELCINIWLKNKLNNKLAVTNLQVTLKQLNIESALNQIRVTVNQLITEYGKF